MVPKSKANLHECQYHLVKLRGATSVEEFEINLAAFVNSARNTTFVLQKEFVSHKEFGAKFLEWYGEKDNPASGSKRHEMANDELCKYFAELRNSIDKEGINGLNFQLKIRALKVPADLIDPPPNSGFAINAKGVVYHVHQGTPQEDYLPARTKGKMEILIQAGNLPKANYPNVHLGKEFKNKNILELTEIYYTYLKNLVEEWTGILNSKTSPENR